MAPAKTSSARKRIKRSRDKSSITFTNEITDDANNQTTIEYQENLQLVFEQPPPPGIHQSTAHPSTDQPSSQSNNRSTPALDNRPSSSSIASASISQSINVSSKSNNRPSASTSNRSTSQSANGSTPNNRSSSSSTSNPSVSQSINISSKSNNSLSTSTLSRSAYQATDGFSPVNPFTSSNNHLSSMANRLSTSYLGSDRLPSSQPEINLASPAKSSSSYLDAAEPLANDTDDLQGEGTRRESLVWKFATRNIDNQTATCTKCNATIKTTNWSTTGLRKHLIQVHKITTITQPVAAKKPTFPPALRKELHELVIKSIIQDSRSFNDYRRPGMLKFLKKAIPGYVPPHRITVARRLKTLHGFYTQRLQQELLTVNKLSITCDFWSDRSLRSYLCITGHYVTYEFDYISTILSFDAFFDRHFGIRIAKIIKEKLNNLNLLNKLLCITTDGAANMRTMCEHLEDVQFDWIWCIAHRNHLTINNALGLWNDKKKKTKKKKNQAADNNKFINNDDNDNSNNNSDEIDQAARTNDCAVGEDEKLFWDDAEKDQSNAQQHMLDFDNTTSTDPVDLNNHDDYDDDIMNIEEILYGVIDGQANIVQNQVDIANANGSLNSDDTKVSVDDETFIDYMNNNASIRDDWDLGLNESNDVFVDELNKQIIYAVLNKCRSLISILKQSTILNGYFTRIRLEVGVKRTLPFDCVTRWNSTYFLIHAFIDAKKAITKFFGEKNLFDVRRTLIDRLISIELHHDDWQILTDLRSVLTPFYLATRTMSVTSYPTAGLCYYTVKKLYNYLRKNDEPDENERVKAFKLMLLSQFEHYFCSNQEELNLLKKLAFFDPLGFSVLKENDIKMVESEMKEIIRNEKLDRHNAPTISSSSISSNIPPIPPTNAKNRSTIEQFLLACGEDPIIDERETRNERLSFTEELILYKEYITAFFRKFRPYAYALDFWKQHYPQFPILAELARIFLSTPGTSVPSESSFSLSAYVARKERARLNPETLSYTMFMKDKIASEG